MAYTSLANINEVLLLKDFGTELNLGVLYALLHGARFLSNIESPCHIHRYTHIGFYTGVVAVTLWYICKWVSSLWRLKPT